MTRLALPFRCRFPGFGQQIGVGLHVGIDEMAIVVRERVEFAQGGKFFLNCLVVTTDSDLDAIVKRIWTR